MSYNQLSIQERYVIYHLVLYGLGFCEIGRRLNRAASTISREVKRNKGLFQPVYWHEAADKFSKSRRAKAPRPSKRENSVLYKYVEEKLREGWSPEIISGRLAEEYPEVPDMQVSHETIYRWVYADAHQGSELYRCLIRSHKKRRKHRKRLSLRGQIPGRVGIEQRPEIVKKRSRIGDWESDTMEGAKGKGALATHVDRKSRYLVAAKLEDKRAKTYTDHTLKAFRGIPGEKRQTMTVDNGKEFSDFKSIEKKLRLNIYFADPYASWQRGTNENTNGLIRRYFPKGTDFTKINRKSVAKVVKKLNNRPRKCLNYQTPHEVFFEKPIVALQT